MTIHVADVVVDDYTTNQKVVLSHEERYAALRRYKLSTITTKELIDELCKRGCVTTIIVEDDERTGFCYIVNGNDKATKVWGAATILVIK